MLNLPQIQQDKLSTTLDAIPKNPAIASNGKWFLLMGLLSSSVPVVVGVAGMFSWLQHMLNTAYE